MKKLSLAVGALLLALLAYIAAGPYITVYHIKQALTVGDTQALAKHIQFDAVRHNLKLQIQQKIEAEFSQSSDSNPMAKMLGNAFLNSMADKLLESYVTPEGIQLLMQGVDPKANSNPQKAHKNNSDAALSNAKLRYQSHDTFLVEINTNTKGDIMTLRLSRTGLNWQLTGIEMPW